MKQAVQNAFDELGFRKFEFEDHDVKILFGDLNFRIDLSFDYVI